MKFIIPGGNVKTMGKVIHCLAKIGDEVFLEPSVDSLTMRAVNLSRSAFAQFNFSASFFSSIEDDAEMSDDGPSDENCKVMVRSLLLAFRSLVTLDKTVDTCTLWIDNINSKLNVSFKCRHHIGKEFSLGLLEYENSRPMYDINECNNKWMILASLMQEANGNFLPNQEEVTMTVRGDSFKMKNYIDLVDETKQKHEIHSELSMQPGEFEMYDISQDASVTFCLKEFRSLLTFAEFCQVPIMATFSDGGSPLVLSLSQGEILTCTYVLATLAEEDTLNPTSNIAAASRTSLSIPSVAPTSILHSTQRETNNMETELMPLGVRPDVSTIPALDLKSNTPDDANEIEGSPPAKKKNFLFRRCFNSTWHPSQVAGHQQVLAPDSDEEEMP